MLTNKEFLALNLDQANEALNEALDTNGYEQPEQPYATLTAVRKAYKELLADIQKSGNETELGDAGEVDSGVETTTVEAKVSNRGPVQGIGVFAKERILAGLTNAEVLAEVKANFPSAKTSSACIGYYRTKLVEAGKLTSSRRPGPKVEVKQEVVDTEAEEATV